MIHTIHGTISSIEQTALIIMIQGIGLSVTTPRAESYLLNDTITLQTVLHWSPENGPQLFGFSSHAERSLFQLIISCAGIGPKLAITLLSHCTIAACVTAIMQNDIARLSSIKGIGAKKAETIILQLRDKVSSMVMTTESTHHSQTPAQALFEVTQALSSLRYSTAEINSALNALRQEGIPAHATFDQLMRRALSLISRSGKAG